MAFTFNELFTYETIERCKDFPERDSDSYINCIMLNTVNSLKAGQHIPYICVGMELVHEDQHQFLYDRDIKPPFPFTYKYSQRTSDTECVYYECKMLQDVGEFLTDEEYPQITVLYSLYAFDEEDELIAEAQ